VIVTRCETKYSPVVLTAFRRIIITAIARRYGFPDEREAAGPESGRAASRTRRFTRRLMSRKTTMPARSSRRNLQNRLCANAARNRRPAMNAPSGAPAVCPTTIIGKRRSPTSLV
jgi:hypothetical protein